MSNALLKFMKRSPLNRFIVGFIAIFASGIIASLVILYPMRIIYYGFATGNYLLNVQSVTAEKSVEQDDDLGVAFCREPRIRITARNNIRTFYLTESGDPVFQRTLPDGIDYSSNEGKCIPLKITSEQRPNDLGKYRFCQEFDFVTEFGQKKTVHFCSTEFEVKEPVRDPVPPETLNVTE